MTKTISNLSQFIFPILAVICFLKGVAGKYTIQTIICLLLAGFLFSIYLIFSQKLILWGMVNIGVPSAKRGFTTLKKSKYKKA
jgi:hypothetical protein